MGFDLGPVLINCWYVPAQGINTMYNNNYTLAVCWTVRRNSFYLFNLTGALL